MRDILWTVREIAGLVSMGYFSVEDIRRRELATAPLLLAGGAGLVLSFLCGTWVNPDALCSFLPGLVCLLLARVSRESIGYGDGLVILCMGAYLSPEQLLGLCMAAITLAGIAALFLLIVLRRGRGTTLPFVPFLLAGYVLIVVKPEWFGG